MNRIYVTGPDDLGGRLHIDAQVGIIELDYLGVAFEKHRFKSVHARLSPFTTFIDVKPAALALTIFRLKWKDMDNPNLTAMLRAMAFDNGMSTLPRHKWTWPENVAALESLAAGLTDPERETLVCGEDQEQRAILGRKPGLAPLETFLVEAFDGELSQCFFEY